MVAVAALLAAKLHGTVSIFVGKMENTAVCCASERDCLFSTLLVLGILLQTLLRGGLVRQKLSACWSLCVAMFVIVFAIVVGVRLWGLYPHIRVSPVAAWR